MGKRISDQMFNLNYFINQLLLIDKIRAKIEMKLHEQDQQS